MSGATLAHFTEPLELPPDMLSDHCIASSMNVGCFDVQLRQCGYEKRLVMTYAFGADLST